MKSRSSPSPRSNDWKVWQWLLTVPGSSARPGKRHVAGLRRAGRLHRRDRPSVIAIARSGCQPSGVNTRSGSSRMVV